VTKRPYTCSHGGVVLIRWINFWASGQEPVQIISALTSLTSANNNCKLFYLQITIHQSNMKIQQKNVSNILFLNIKVRIYISLHSLRGATVILIWITGFNCSIFCCDFWFNYYGKITYACRTYTLSVRIRSHLVYSIISCVHLYCAGCTNIARIVSS